MTARTSLEEALNFLVNEDNENAVKAFHSFVVKSAQNIHESLLEDDDLDNDIDEAVDEEEKVDEAKDKSSEDEVTESDDKEEVDERDNSKEVDENFGMDRSSIRSDEYFGRDELATEDHENDMDMGDVVATDDLGDEMGGDYEGSMEGEEVTLSPEDADAMRSAMDELQAKFDELGIGGSGEEEGMDMDMDMGDEMDTDDKEGDMNDMEPEESFTPEVTDSMDIDRKRQRAGKSGQYESTDPELDEGEEEEEVDEAITHDAGVVGSKHGVDHDGKHGQQASNLHNSDAKLPEAAVFDFDLTEEDFLDLEEGLKKIDVKMGGEQGGVKFAGEETQIKSPVAQRDKSDIKAGSKDMISKRDDHSGYSLETAPSAGNLPHSGDNSHDSMDGTGSPKRSEVSKGGGLDKQSSYGDGEVGAGKFAGTETNVKSPIGSAGTRNES